MCSLCCVQVPSLCEDLLSSVDQPLKIARDKVVGKDYLLCDYNRDGDSYRWGFATTFHLGPTHKEWTYDKMHTSYECVTFFSVG